MTQARPLLAALVALLALAPSALAGAVSGTDDFPGATGLSGGGWDLAADNTSADGEAGEPNHEGFTWPELCLTAGMADDPCNPSVWWSWTADEDGVASLEVDCADAYAFTSAVYTGTAVNALTPVVDPALACRWSWRAVEGQVYRLVFSGAGDEAEPTGTLTARLDLAPSQPNDAFPGTTLTGESGAFAGSNVDATGQDGEPDHAGGSLQQDCDDGATSHHGCIESVWWSWTSPRSGPATFDTCGSDYDTTLAVYTGNSVGALSEVASNDEAAGCGPDVGFGMTSGSRVFFDAVAGQTYRIAVAGYQAFIDEALAPTGAIAGSFSGPEAPAPLVTPPPVVTPGAGTGGADTLFAGASFSGSRTINVSGNRFPVRLRSPEDASVAIGATSSKAYAVQRRKRRRKVRVGSARTSLLANVTKTVRLRVSRKALRVLRARRKLRTVITVTGTDKAGNRKVTKRTVTLRLKRKKRRSGGGSGALARRSHAGR